MDVATAITSVMTDNADAWLRTGQITGLTHLPLVDLTLDGGALTLPKLDSYRSPAIGDVVLVLTAPGRQLVLGSVGAGGGGPLFMGAAGGITTTLTTGVWTPIQLGSDLIDTHDGHSTTVNASRFIVPAGWGGIYRCSGITLLGGGAGGTVRAACIAKNGVQLNYTQTNSTGAGSDGTVQVLPALLALVPADYVELQAFQNTGANRPNSPNQSSFTVEYVRASS